MVVLANKQDLPRAMTASQIADGLELRSIEKKHKWHIQPCCAISGEGIYEAMEYIGKMSSEYLKRKSTTDKE